jgi:hypothetical protein
MLRRPSKPTPIAVALRVASLLVLASGVFGILIGDITRRGADAASVEKSSRVTGSLPAL